MTPITQSISPESPPWPISQTGIPIIYEDEDVEIGDAAYHYSAVHIAFACLTSFLKSENPSLRVSANLNCCYALVPRHPKTGVTPYFSADLMIVRPSARDHNRWGFDSYTIGKEGPPPEVVIEVLSAKTAEMLDLGAKLIIYSKLGIKEYILVDPIGQFLPKRLIQKRLRPNGQWKDRTDDDGGVTSELGFRLLLDENGELVVFNAKTHKRYVRPQEAEAEADARRLAEERAQAAAEAWRLAEKRAEARRFADAQAAEARIRALEEELNRLRQPPP